MIVCWHEDIFRGSTMDRTVLVSCCKTTWKRLASNVSVGKAETYIDDMRQKRTAHRGETIPYPRPRLGLGLTRRRRGINSDKRRHCTIVLARTILYCRPNLGRFWPA